MPSSDSTQSRKPGLLPLANQRQSLRADCANCAGLCCVAPGFQASADFAITKQEGQPCPNLRTDFRCGIHEKLRDQGFPGCVVFDCFGAGQHVTQELFDGSDWQVNPSIAGPMFAVFPVIRQLKEVLWYLTEALALVPGSPLAREITEAVHQTEQHTNAAVSELVNFDIAGYRHEIGALLAKVSENVRSQTGGTAANHRNADLIGSKLRGTDLRCANLRGAYLIGADLRGTNLAKADLLGTDLRATDIRGAALAEALFLTQPQVEAATGDASTAIPPVLSRPQHWPSTATNSSCDTRRANQRRNQRR